MLELNFYFPNTNSSCACCSEEAGYERQLEDAAANIPKWDMADWSLVLEVVVAILGTCS